MSRESLAEVLSEDLHDGVSYPVTWPVEFESGTGVTRDLSAYGASIATDRVLAEGDVVRFTVRMPGRSGGATRLLCEGRVTRVEPLGNQWEVSVSFEAVDFEV